MVARVVISEELLCCYCPPGENKAGSINEVGRFMHQSLTLK